MRSRSCGAAVAFALVASTPSVARGIGLAVSHHSAESLAMGGAIVAKPGLSSAGFHNAAAAGAEPGLRLYGGVMALAPKTTATDPETGIRESSRFVVYPLPHVYASYVKGSLGAAVFVGVPFGGGARFDETWRGRFDVVSAEIRTLVASPSVTLAISDHVFLAAGPSFAQSAIVLERRIDQVLAEADARLGLDSAVGVGATASVFARVTPEMSLGLNYRSRIGLGFEGGIDFEGVVPEFERLLRDQGARANLTLPDVLAAGAYYQLGRVGLGASAEYWNWALVDEIAVSFDDPALDSRTPLAWESGFTGALGGEVRVGGPLRLRAGLSLETGVGSAEVLTPMIPDAHNYGIGLGARYELGNAVFDLAYALGGAFRRSAAPPRALAATYDRHAHFVALSVGWSGRERDPVRRMSKASRSR